MRLSSLFFFLLLLVFTDLKAQDATKVANVTVEGFISNHQGNYIENAHVVNVSGNTGTISNREGQFRINVTPGDILRFTCVGYDPLKYEVPVEKYTPVIPLHIVMQSDTLQLTGVNIYPWPADAEALKEAILAMEDQTPKVPDLKLNDPKYYNMPLPGGQPQRSSTPGLASPGFTVTVPGPITALYDAFSKEGKSKRKLESLVNQDQKKVIAARRYNAKVVQQVTSFKTDKEIQDFMLFCNLSVDFIVSSTEYELYKAMHECLLAYNEGKKGKM